jgi:hypothetical protein
MPWWAATPQLQQKSTVRRIMAVLKRENNHEPIEEAAICALKAERSNGAQPAIAG